MKAESLLVLLALAAVVAYCRHEPDEWRGFVYPDKYNLTVHYEVGVHKSADACTAAARNALRITGKWESGDYECGLNCEADMSLGGLNVCKETVK
jgi:hypothetical protein